MNRRQFLSLPRLYFQRSAIGRLLWREYARSAFDATMASPTIAATDFLIDMFQYGKTYLIVRGNAFDDVHLSLSFDTWAQAEAARDALLSLTS